MANCIDSMELEQLAAGFLRPAAQVAAEAHLQDCAVCRNALARAADNEQLFRRIREALKSAHHVKAMPCQLDWDSSALPAGMFDAIEGYEILSELHRGGQGVVFKATQKATKRLVALKILLRGAQATDRQRLRFEREIEWVAGLKHPNIVTIYDSGVSHGRQFYAMEYVAGLSLDKHLKDPTKISSRSIRDTLRLFHKICSAVGFAHQRGVIHRDLKPGNIVIDAAGEPHVLDFGLAKLADEAGAGNLTAADEFLGTLAYASPEQTKGVPQDIDMRSDVYSLGVVLYEMLTGRLPYQVTGSLSQVLREITEATPAYPSQICRAVDHEVEAIVLKALAKEPERRYQSAEHLGRDVWHYLNGDSIDAKRDSTWYLIRKSVRRHRVAVATAASFLAVIAVALIVSLILWRQAVTDRDLARHAQGNEQTARRSEEQARISEHRQREEAEFQSYTANIAAAAGALRMHDVVEAGRRLHAAPHRLRDWEWHQLARLLDGSGETFEGHASYVTGVAISPDGGLVASAGRDQTVKLWNAKSGELVASLSGPSKPAIAFHPDGRQLAIAWSDGTIRLWDVASQNYTATLVGPTGNIDVVEFSPDAALLAAATNLLDGVPSQHAVLLWRLASGELVQQIPFSHWRVADMAFSPDGAGLAVARFDGVALWETSTGNLKLRLPDQPGGENCVAFSHDGRLIASAGRDNAVHLWDAESGKPERVLRGHTGAVTSVAFGPGDEHVVSGSRDKTVRTWKTATGEPVQVFAGHRWTVTSVAVSGDGQRIVSGSWDQTVKLWDGLAAQASDLLAGHDGLIGTVAFSLDGKLLATASWDHTIKLWDQEKRQELATLTGHGAPVHGVAFSPDAKLLASGGWNGALKLWDVPGRHELVALPGHAENSRVHSVAFAPGGEWLVSGSSDNTLRIWDVATHEPLAVLTGHTDHIHAVAISPDGKWIASAGHETVKVWDVARRVEAASFPRRMVQDDYSLAFHPDSRRLAAGSDVRTITVWDVIERKPVQVFTGHTDEIHAVAISPDGRRLVSAAFDNSVKLWDLASGREVATLFGHSSHANTIAYSPSGRHLVAGLENGSLKIWDGFVVERDE